MELELLSHILASITKETGRLLLTELTVTTAKETIFFCPLPTDKASDPLPFSTLLPLSLLYWLSLLYYSYAVYCLLWLSMNVWGCCLEGEMVALSVVSLLWGEGLGDGLGDGEGEGEGLEIVGDFENEGDGCSWLRRWLGFVMVGDCMLLFLTENDILRYPFSGVLDYLYSCSLANVGVGVLWCEGIKISL